MLFPYLDVYYCHAAARTLPATRHDPHRRSSYPSMTRAATVGDVGGGIGLTVGEVCVDGVQVEANQAATRSGRRRRDHRRGDGPCPTAPTVGVAVVAARGGPRDTSARHTPLGESGARHRNRRPHRLRSALQARTHRAAGYTTWLGQGVSPSEPGLERHGATQALVPRRRVGLDSMRYPRSHQLPTLLRAERVGVGSPPRHN